MTFADRMKYQAFVSNRGAIEAKWDTSFGDRENELVFIGQNMDEFEIRKDLVACLCDETEISLMHQGKFGNDEWPV